MTKADMTAEYRITFTPETDPADLADAYAHLVYGRVIAHDRDWAVIAVPDDAPTCEYLEADLERESRVRSYSVRKY